MKVKYIHATGNDATLGWKYDDGSLQPLLRLYNDQSGRFQMEFLDASNASYSFLPACGELLAILKSGIVGVPIRKIGQMLMKAGYETDAPRKKAAVHKAPSDSDKTGKRYIDIQNDVITKYHIDICDGTKCEDGDWDRTHAHIRLRRVCKWKRVNSIESTFTLCHEVGHIVNNNSRMRRAEAEYYATMWAIKEMESYGLTVPEKTLKKYQEYIDREVDRGKRRGGTGYSRMRLPGM